MLHTAEGELPLLPCEQAEDISLWFSHDPADQAEAKRRCKSCIRKLECLENTVETERAMGTQILGVHGGMTPAERVNIESIRLIA